MIVFHSIPTVKVKSVFSAKIFLQGVLTWHGSHAVYLIIPELSDFLVLHSRVIPDEVCRLILIPGLDEVHLVDDYANCGEIKKKTNSY